MNSDDTTSNEQEYDLEGLMVAQPSMAVSAVLPLSLVTHRCDRVGCTSLDVVEVHIWLEAVNGKATSLIAACLCPEHRDELGAVMIGSS